MCRWRCLTETWRECVAHEKHLAHAIPSPRKKRASVRIQIAAAILRDPRGLTILVKDPGAHDGGLFSHMWQFPAVQAGHHPEAELIEHLRATLDIKVDCL